MAELIKLSEKDARTMNALKQSISFYKSKKEKKYDRALLKEERMLKSYFSKIRAETIPEELLAA